MVLLQGRVKNVKNAKVCPKFRLLLKQFLRNSPSGGAKGPYHINKVMRVLVVSNDALARDGLTSILLREGLFPTTLLEVFGAVTGGQLDESGNVFVVTDDLSKAEWAELAKIKESHGAKVVVVASSGGPGLGRIADAVVDRCEGAAGVVGAVHKFMAESPRAIAEALQLRYGGRRLSKRELEVAQYVAQGLGNRRIAQLLELREQSVKNLVSCIMMKLDCDNRTQVALALLGKGKGKAH